MRNLTEQETRKPKGKLRRHRHSIKGMLNSTGWHSLNSAGPPNYYTEVKFHLKPHDFVRYSQLIVNCEKTSASTQRKSWLMKKCSQKKDIF